VTTRGFDPNAVAGKFPEPDRQVEVLVIGAGSAGVAAAIDAARNGAQVLLVDENPVSPGLMGLDTPLYYGARYTGAVQARGRMIEQVFAARPALAEAFDAGVEIELGVSCWGAWVNGYGLAALPGPVAGLADEDRAWMVGFERLILATGARDLCLAFEGWDQPGVMGAQGLAALLEIYDAFAGRRLVILGSGELALRTALLALRRGLEVAALIEVEGAARGPADLLAELAAAGVPIHVGATPIRAVGGLNGAEAVIIQGSNGDPFEIVCDTVVEALGVVPNIELLDGLGAGLAMQPALGGHVPVSADGRATTLAEVFIAGDVAGVAQAGVPDALAYRQTWMRALMAAGPDDVVICQCEAVTREALLGVRQPAYLGAPPPAMARRDLASLLESGPANQDQIKRLTRAGMGPCQGRRCREQVALALACASNGQARDIPLASYRAPVRPLPLKVLADWDEAKAMSNHWDVWLGIPTQWVPYDDIGTEREALLGGVLAGEVDP
jgi:thioredoxin reductase